MDYTSSSSSSGGGISLVAFEVFYPSSSSSSFLSKVHSSFGCRVGFDGQLSFERPKYNVVVVVDDRPSGCCHFCRSCRESLASQKEEMKVGRNEKKTTIRSCLSHLRQGAVRDDVTSQSTSSWAPACHLTSRPQSGSVLLHDRGRETKHTTWKAKKTNENEI